MKSNCNVGVALEQLPDDLESFKLAQPNLGFSLENLADCFQVPIPDLWDTIHTHLHHRAATTEGSDDSLSSRPLRLVASRRRQRIKAELHKPEEKTR